MQTGSVVISVKGHDKDTVYVVTECGKHSCFICNGNQKKLSNPKKKNKKHLKDTGEKIELSLYNPLYDAHIRKALKSLCVENLTVYKK